MYYATQGGGKALFGDLGQLIWVEPPTDYPEMVVGGEVPREWDYQGPFNDDGTQYYGRNPAYDGPMGIFTNYGEEEG